MSQWAATDVRGVRGQIQGTLRAPLWQVGRIQGTSRGAITKGSGTLGKGQWWRGGQDLGIFEACGWPHLGTGGVGARRVCMYTQSCVGRSNILRGQIELEMRSAQWI